MNHQENKKYLLFCEPCSFKKIVMPGEEPGLVEIKISTIPTGVPQYDAKTKKTIFKKDLTQKRKFKCPNCGRGIAAKQLPQPYAKSISETEEFHKKRQDEADKMKRIEDGIPIQRNANDAQFTG